jgi:hypothetical protein
MKRNRNRTRDRYEPDPVARDGESIAVPIELCDHRPGYAAPSWKQIADRAAARQLMIDRARTGWLMDKRRPRDDDEDDDDDDDDANDRARARRGAADARSAYLEMCDRLESSWRSPPPAASFPMGLRGRDAAERTLSTPSAPSAPRRPVPGSTADPFDPQKKRDMVYESYAASLSEQWKTGPGGMADPLRAAAIERTREQVHGGR